MWLTYNQNVSLAVLFVAAYVVAAYFCNKDILRCAAACLLCQIYGLTPLYTYTVETSPSFAFVVYASIYFSSIKKIKSYKTMIACFTMGALEIVMCGAYNDWFSPQGLNSWLYQNYELLVAFVHAYIIVSMVRWSFVKRTLGGFSDSVLLNIVRNSLSLHL